MPNFEVELIESKSIIMHVVADNEEDASSQAEEEYYATHSVDDTLADFYVKDATEIPGENDEWGV